MKISDAWPKITAENRPWTRWWWLGSAVDKKTITRLMKTYRNAGLGGVEVTSIYGVKGQEKRNLDYMSPQWLDMLRHTIAEAKRLDMQVDIPNTSGWRTGGNYVTDNLASAKLQIEKSDSMSEYTVRIIPLGELVKRAGPGGTGKTFNPFSRASLQAVIEHFTPLLENIGIRSQFHDSWEYGSDACPELFEYFRERRGYDFRKHLTEFVDKNDMDRHARVKYDLQLTLAEMALDCFITPWVEWCHELGQISRNQAHGSPSNWLDLYAAADIPETESYRDITPDTPLIAKFASSAAHVAGKTLVSSETGTWFREHFHTTLADMKRLIDNLFVSGINHHIYHGTAYSPSDAAWPGWLFYAPAQLNPQNSIWHDFKKLNEYTTRCQAVLQNGEPDNDLLVYFPIHDLLHDPARKLAEKITINGEWLKELSAIDTFRQLWQRGYGFDYISDRQLADIGISGRAIITQGGNSYRALIVPPCRFMPMDTLARLAKMSRSGGNIIFLMPPSDVPGLIGLDNKCRNRFKTLSAEVIIHGDIETALAGLNIRREQMTDNSGLFFIRRRHDLGRDYFVANQGCEFIDKWISLGVDCESVLVMDPMSGEIGATQTRNGAKGEVRIQLESGASLILRALNERTYSVKSWSYTSLSGSECVLNGIWHIEFIKGGPELPVAYTTRTLSSWTEHGSQEECFAGTAVYRTGFNAPTKKRNWLLDLGEVHSSARIRFNGKELGIFIGPVFKTILKNVKQTGNILEIEITNLAANRIRHMDRSGIEWRIFEDVNFINRQLKPFDSSNSPLVKSGLIGPVRLLGLR